MTFELVAEESLELRSSVGGSRGERQRAGLPQLKAFQEPPTDVSQTAGFTRTLENGPRTARRWRPPWSPRATIPANIHADAFASVLGHFRRFPLLSAVAEDGGKPGFNPAAALAYFTPVDGGASSLSLTRHHEYSHQAPSGDRSGPCWQDPQGGGGGSQSSLRTRVSGDYHAGHVFVTADRRLPARSLQLFTPLCCCCQTFCGVRGGLNRASHDTAIIKGEKDEIRNESFRHKKGKFSRKRSGYFQQSSNTFRSF